MPDRLPGQPVSAVAAENGVRDFTRIRKYFLAVLLPPLFAAISSLFLIINIRDWSSFLRAAILFEAITLFLPAANYLIRSECKRKTSMILGGAFLTGMIACALAFPLTTSTIPRTCPVHYLFSGGIYLTLSYGVYLLHVRYGFRWLSIFLAAMAVGISGFIFIHIPVIASWNFLGIVAGASLLNAMPIALFLTVLFIWLNPHKVTVSGKRSILKTMLAWVITLILLAAAGIFSLSFNQILFFEKEAVFLLTHFSDYSAIRTLSGQLESYDTIIKFSPGKKPVEEKVRMTNRDDASADGLIRILPKKNEKGPSIFQYKEIKQLYSLSPEHRYGFWEGSRYFCFSGDQTWTQLIFHGDASPAIRTFRADAVCPVPGKDAVFYSLDDDFFHQEGNQKPRLIYSAKTFFNFTENPYIPISTGFTPGFSHIFYGCWKESIFSHSPHFLFIFETTTNKFYALDLSENGREYSPLQWKEKK